MLLLSNKWWSDRLASFPKKCTSGPIWASSWLDGRALDFRNSANQEHWSLKTLQIISTAGEYLETRANCCRKVREIKSGSWERWFGRRGWRMIICKRPGPLHDHMQVARSSVWSFAKGEILWMIICKRPEPPDDHLPEAGSSGWSFASSLSLQMFNCKGLDPPEDHLQEAGSSRWSFARGQIRRMIICKRPNPLNDHFQVDGWLFERG